MPDKVAGGNWLLAEMRRVAEINAMEIDFAKLEADGAIRKRGTWYEVLDMKLIPAAVRQRVKSMKQTTRRSAKGVQRGPLLVQFRKANPRLRRLLDQPQSEEPSSPHLPPAGGRSE